MRRRLRAMRRRCVACARRGAVILGQDQHDRIRLFRHRANPHYGTPGNPASTRARPAAPRRCRVPSRTACARSRSAPIPAAHPAFPPRSAASSGTSRPSSGCRPTARFPCRTRSIRSGRSREPSACAAADAVMAGDDPWTLEPVPLQSLGSAFPKGLPLRGLDQHGRKFFDATQALGRPACACPTSYFRSSTMTEGQRLGDVRGGRVPVDPPRAARDAAADYDPFVRSRIEAGRTLSAADYMAMLRDRTALVRAMDARSPISTRWYCRRRRSSLRRSARRHLEQRRLHRTQCAGPAQSRIANFFDLCAIRFRCRARAGCRLDDAVARNGHDRRLFRIAAAVERLFAG